MTAITGLAHVEIFVPALDKAVDDFCRYYAFTVDSMKSDSSDFRRATLTQGKVRIVLTEGRSDDHPASAYVLSHGAGVADIALRVDDAAEAFAGAVARGARPVGNTAVAGFGDVVHSFVDAAEPAPGPYDDDVQMVDIDHLAVCVPAGELDGTVDFYRDVLGFRHTFSERIEVGGQAMNSKVVQSVTGAITLTIIEPDTTRAPGQIDTFIKNHDGAGVQHLAFATGDAVRAVRALRRRGVTFLTTPDTYYDALTDRVEPAAHNLGELREHHLLIDQDHGGQLFQIFTRSEHPRRTLFFEIIERLGAESFGTANITALYEAVQRDQVRN